MKILRLEIVANMLVTSRIKQSRGLTWRFLSTKAKRPTGKENTTASPPKKKLSQREKRLEKFKNQVCHSCRTTSALSSLPLAVPLDSSAALQASSSLGSPPPPFLHCLLFSCVPFLGLFGLMALTPWNASPVRHPFV